MEQTYEEVKTYFVTIPAHKFLHIRNYESIGYWDFWERQSRIPKQDCETICGLLSSIPGKLDDLGGTENNGSSDQLMAFINAPPAGSAAGESPLPKATACAFRQTTPERFRLRCS